MDDLLDKVSGAAAYQRLSPSTQSIYKTWIKRYLAGLASEAPGPDSAHRFLLEVRGKVAVGNYQQAVAALRLLLRDVVQPSCEITVPRPERGQRVPVVLSHADALRMIDSLSGDSRLIAGLMYGSGLRLKEALHLRVKDLDFRRGRITVAAGPRTTILPLALVDDLKARVTLRRRMFKDDHGEHSRTPADFGDAFVFASKRDTGRAPILPTNVQRSIQSAARTLGIDVPGPHTLRDSFVARLLAGGVALDRVKEIVGHESTETTAAFLRAIPAGDGPIESPLDK